MLSPITVPLSVPNKKQRTYLDHLHQVTAGCGEKKLFLFAGDQKIEHLNQDFYGPQTTPEAANPEYLFKIASSARIGAFATQLGLIGQYGDAYRSIPYIVKLNSKTNITKKDPLSLAINTIEQIIQFKQESGLNIVGVGYTLYLGSQHEAVMLAQVTRMFAQAHAQGLITVLWSYPRGEAVSDERHPDIIAGAAGVAPCIGADFVKVNPPDDSASLVQATQAAGRTSVICSGGSSQDPKTFISTLHQQLTQGKTKGAAVGRNIHQKPFVQAVAFCNAVASLIYDNATPQDAVKNLKH